MVEWFLILSMFSSRLAADNAIITTIPMQSRTACLTAIANLVERNPAVEKHLGMTCLSTVTGELVGREVPRP